MRIALVVAAALFAAVAVCTPLPASDIIPICGDADNEGHITESDAVSAMRAAVHLPAVCPIAVCDVNADDRISVTDGVNILRNALALPAVVDCRDVTGGQ